MLETHFKLCVTVGFFQKHLFAQKRWKMYPKWSNNRLFWIYWKIWSLVFATMKVYIICYVTAQNPFLEKYGSWDMNQNALGQSDCRILKSTISLEQMDEIARFFVFFVWWYKFMKIKCWFEIFQVDVVKNGCGHSGHRTRKFAIFKKWRDGINWFFAWWYKFREAKS